MHAKNVFKFTDINTTIRISVTFFHGKGRSPTSKLESVGLQAKMRSSGAENLWRVHQSILREHKMWLGWIELVFSSLKKNIWFFGSNLPPFLSKTLKKLLNLCGYQLHFLILHFSCTHSFGCTMVKITSDPPCVVKSHICFYLSEFSALLKQLTTPSWNPFSVVFCNTTLFWFCSCFPGFFGFFSFSWLLNVRMLLRFCPVFFLCLHIFSNEQEPAVSSVFLEWWKLSLSYIFLPVALNSLTSASISL